MMRSGMGMGKFHCFVSWCLRCCGAVLRVVGAEEDTSIVNAAWQEKEANVNDAGMRMLSSRSRVM